MATFVFANFLKTTLSSGISSTATTLTVSSTANLPVLQAGQVLPVVLNDAATQSIYEICYATAISSNTLTVTRGQEGTTANTWNTGDYVYTAVTAGSFASLPQLGASNLWTANNNFATLNFVQDTGTQNNIVVNPANPVTLQTGTEINVQVAYSNDSATTLNYANTGAFRVIGAGGPLQGENLVAGYIYKFVYLSGSTNYWYLIASSQGAISVGAATQTEHAVQAGQAKSILIVEEQQTSGTAGGSASAGVNVRQLNVLIANTIPNAAFNSPGSITLPAGTYRVHAFAECWDGNPSKIGLYDTTNGIMRIIGSSVMGSTGGVATNSESHLDGRFALTATATLELQHYFYAASATNGLGYPTSWPNVNEVYSHLTVEAEPF